MPAALSIFSWELVVMTSAHPTVVVTLHSRSTTGPKILQILKSNINVKRMTVCLTVQKSRESVACKIRVRFRQMA
jgi:hypothetical protein